MRTVGLRINVYIPKSYLNFQNYSKPLICYLHSDFHWYVLNSFLLRQVKAILVNVFGGIVNCATIANGIVNAAKSIKMTIPVIVRLEGKCHMDQIMRISYVITLLGS
jgi:CoA-ligase